MAINDTAFAAAAERYATGAGFRHPAPELTRLDLLACVALRQLDGCESFVAQQMYRLVEQELAAKFDLCQHCRWRSLVAFEARRAGLKMPPVDPAHRCGAASQPARESAHAPDSPQATGASDAPTDRPSNHLQIEVGIDAAEPTPLTLDVVIAAVSENILKNGAIARAIRSAR